ncbi:MAG: hypothetical protein SVU32_07735 [Candidatus Nanohaloarchaea archaeon]|nr:hypothetical protein [Candidatus Nanohaloarchaea archaeon]
MRKKGISYTLTIIVSALVILITALAVLALPQQVLPGFVSWIKTGTGGNIDQAKLQRLKSQCKLQKAGYCGPDPPPEAADCPEEIAGNSHKNWACKLQVNGKWCYTYWQKSGSVTQVPECSPD